MPIGSINQPGFNGSTVVDAIANASQRSGVSFDYLLAQARLESSLDPQAKAATSSASGLFQFTKQSWLATVSKHGAANGLGWAANAISQNDRGHFSVAGPDARQQILNLRLDPQASSLMAAEFAQDNGDLLRGRFGAEPEPVDLYLAHFLGGHGAARFLSEWRADPDAAAAPLFAKAAAANQGIFYGKGGQPRSFNEIRERFRAKMDAAGAEGMPPPRFAAGPVGASRFNAAPALKPAQSETDSHLAMQGFEPMPGKLSLAFAARSYGRLAAMGRGA